jgi:PAP2 superfamily protein
VAGAERALGLNVEGALQQAFLDTPWLTALDWVHLAAQSAALAAGIIFVYRARRSAYRVLRTTLLATWVLALPVYALFPTAPPRLAGLGLADSVSAHTPAGGPGDRQPLRDRCRRRPDHDRGRPRRRPADRAARAALRPRRAAGAD